MPGFYDKLYTPRAALAALPTRTAARDRYEWMKAVPPAGTIEGAILYSRDHHLMEAIPLLPAYLRDAPWFLAWAACVTLGDLGGFEALPDLLDLARAAAGEERGLFSTMWFGWYDDTPQEGAIEGLGRLGLSEEGRKHPPLHLHPDQAIRRAAAVAAAELVPLLTTTEGTGHYVRVWVLYALAYIGAPEAAAGARVCLETGDREVRKAAANLLERLARRA